MSELAAIAHLSHSGLGRQFIKVHGVSPFTWITHQRIREMSRLLSETPQPVRDIAQAVGWSNQAHAAQKFRKLTGRSPTEYRAETRRRIVAECFLCGQALPAPETDGDPRAFDGDPSVHG
nr:AraC family transcriptional regulator [Brevibacterium luteolum]